MPGYRKRQSRRRNPKKGKVKRTKEDSPCSSDSESNYEENDNPLCRSRMDLPWENLDLPRCECPIDEDGEFILDRSWTRDCQSKVNNGLMTYNEKQEVCKCNKEYIIISNKEKGRLETVWNKNDHQWKWVLNEEDNCYHPVFE
tara:strand:- start:245 stop:673 length:429 start_codon:yes stop_codon:yes gene_type:complete